MRTPNSFPTFVLTLLVTAALGCSISESISQSSESVSDSVEHSSDSVSRSFDSSSPDHDASAEHARYQRDVEHYTAAFVRAGGESDASFFAGLGDLARSHGVSDWEADASTWEAIGRGLARSPASAAEQAAYQTAWTGGDAGKQDAVARGIRTVP